MKSCGFNVFKCIVNIYNEDFGVFGPPKAKKGVGTKAEQHGSGVGPVGEPKDDVMESQSGVGGDGGWFWALVIFLDAGGWMVELWSLLGRLWWRWILRWAEIGKSEAQAIRIPRSTREAPLAPLVDKAPRATWRALVPHAAGLDLPGEMRDGDGPAGPGRKPRHVPREVQPKVFMSYGVEFAARDRNRMGRHRLRQREGA